MSLQYTHTIIMFAFGTGMEGGVVVMAMQYLQRLQAVRAAVPARVRARISG